MLIHAVTGKSQQEDAHWPGRQVVGQNRLSARQERGAVLFARGKRFLYKFLTLLGRPDPLAAGSAPPTGQHVHRPAQRFRLGKLGKIVSLKGIFRLKDRGDPTENELAAFGAVKMRAGKSATQSC